MFFVTHVVVLRSKEILDSIIIGDFGEGVRNGNARANDVSVS
jgi:hypothetical protein